jgi:hypothetical protein
MDVNKEQAALNKIIGQLFRQYSLGDYGAETGTFRVNFPKINPTTKILVWGGVVFSIQHETHGKVQVELVHDTGAFFKLQFTNDAEPEVPYRIITQIPFDNLDNETVRMIEEEREGSFE